MNDNFSRCVQRRNPQVVGHHLELTSLVTRLTQCPKSRYRPIYKISEQTRTTVYTFKTVWCSKIENWFCQVIVIVSTNEGRKEGNVLFHDALNTFYLRLYGVTHMVKNHSDNERGNPLPPHRLLFPISSKGSFICIIPQTG